MIKTKAGHPIKIVKGSRKSITGKKPFLVEFLYTPEDILKRIVQPKLSISYGKRFYLTKNELSFDSEDELYEALGLKKDGE